MRLPLCLRQAQIPAPPHRGPVVVGAVKKETPTMLETAAQPKETKEAKEFESLTQTRPPTYRVHGGCLRTPFLSALFVSFGHPTVGLRIIPVEGRGSTVERLPGDPARLSGFQSNPYFSNHAWGRVPKLSSQSLNRCKLQPRPSIRRRCNRWFSRRPSQ